MRMKNFFILIAFVVSQLKADQSAANLCTRFKGTWQLSKEFDKPHTCTNMEFPIPTKTTGDAKLLCNYRIPFKLSNSFHGPVTKCSFNVYVNCPFKWYQINGKCYMMLPVNSKSNAITKCQDKKIVKLNGAVLADIMSPSLARFVSMVFTNVGSDVWVNSISSQLKTVKSPILGTKSTNNFQLVFDNAFRYEVQPGRFVKVGDDRSGFALCAYTPPPTPRSLRLNFENLKSIARVYEENGRIYMIPYNHYHLDDKNKNPTGKGLHDVCKKFSVFFNIDTAHAAYPIGEETSGLKNALKTHGITYAMIPAVTVSSSHQPVENSCSNQDAVAVKRFRKVFSVELPDGKLSQVDDNAWASNKPGGECSRIPRKAAVMHQNGVYDIPNIYRGNVVCAMKGDAVIGKDISPPCSKHATYNSATGECTCKPGNKDYVDLGKFEGPRGFMCQACDTKTTYGIVVVVLDYSGSMQPNWNDYMIPFVKGIYNAFKGTPVGLVWFGNYADVGADIHEFSSQQEWDALLNRHDPWEDPYTWTNTGIDKAVDVIRDYETKTNKKYERKSILLLTDGEPYPVTQSTVQQSAIRAHKAGIKMWQVFVGSSSYWSSSIYKKMKFVQCDGINDPTCEQRIKYLQFGRLDASSMTNVVQEFCVDDDTV